MFPWSFEARQSELIEEFGQNVLTPEQARELENVLAERLREVGRRLIQWLYAQLEPDPQQMPGTVSHRGKSYRRLAEKTRRSDLVTRFGKISLVHGRYRRGRFGQTIFPLEMILGIVNGSTPAAATRVGKQFAACGNSQGRALEMIADQMGERIGTEKLRKLVGTLYDGMEPFRQEAQVQKLVDLVRQARTETHSPVLSVSREGVALGLATRSYFEMASVACISVLADGKKFGTVYLGCTPEGNQATLSSQLTSLLKATIRAFGDQVPEIVYVSDAGKIETAHWKNALRKFFVDGVRIKITRVVDYYHASARLTTIADSLMLDEHKSKREEWLKHVLGLLLEPGGQGRVLRNISVMRKLYGWKATSADQSAKAERYLRRYRRFMDYAEMK